MEDVVGHSSPLGNQEATKDERPVFERLKSLAEGLTEILKKQFLSRPYHLTCLSDLHY